MHIYTQHQPSNGIRVDLHINAGNPNVTEPFVLKFGSDWEDNRIYMSKEELLSMMYELETALHHYNEKFGASDE